MNITLMSTRITTLFLLAGLTGLDVAPLQARMPPPEIRPLPEDPTCDMCPVSRSPARQTLNELQAVGDFNGDGRPDVVIADKRSGLLRFGIGQSGGGFVWPKPVSVGARDLNTGIAVGRFRADRDGVAVTSPGMNRIQVVHYEDAAPHSITPIGIGSSALAALPTGPNVYHDLFAATTMNSPSAPYRIELHENAGDGSAFNPVGSLPTYNAFVAARHLAAVPLHRSTNSALALAFLLMGGAEPVLQVHGVSAADPFDRIPEVTNALTQVSLSSTVTAFDFGFFDGEENGLMPHYLYRSSTFTTLILCPFRFGGDPSVYFFHVAAQQFWNPGAQITGMNGINVEYFSVIRREAPATDRIVITFPFGPTMAAVYDYNGEGVPTLVTAIPRPTGGDDVTGLIPLGFGSDLLQTGEWLLLTGANGLTTGAQHYDADGTLIASGETSRLSALASRANVFYFDADPVTSPSAQLAGTRSAGDWTVAVSNFPGAVEVGVSRFDGGEKGLVADGSRELGGAPARAVAVGINQTILPAGAEDFTGSLSLASLEGAAGEMIPEAVAVPAGGLYDRAVRVSFSAPETVTVLYRTTSFFQPTDWVAWSGEELDITQSLTLEWFTEQDGLRSPVRQASYQLSSNGDSDGDGVPDAVELAFGLDPNGGLDSDGDGVSDFIEILAGTNPNDPDDVPALPVAGLSSPQSGAAFTLEATIASVDGRAGGDPDRLAAEGVPVAARVPGGGLLTTAPVEGEGKAVLSGIPVSSDFSLVLVTAPVVYPIDVGGDTAADYGREVFALVREPAVSAASLPDPSWYTGDPASEVARWTNDVWNALAIPDNNREPRASVEVDVVSTLKALLFERIVGDLLELDEPTLHPTRAGDEARTPIVLADLDRLRNPPAPTGPRIVPKPWPFVPPEPDRPAFDGYTILSRLDELLNNPAPDSNRGQLINLARIIYASSTREPAIMTVDASPVDALRTFIKERIVIDVYHDEDVFASVLSQALDGLDELLGENGEQELVRMVLRVDYATGPECTTLARTDVEYGQVALVNQFGLPYVFAPDFPLVPGSLVGVVGYEAELPMMCFSADTALRVMEVRLVDLPSVEGTDADGNAIADAFEAQFLGGAGGNLFDTVAAGEQVYQMLQLFLEGIDAQTAAAMGITTEDLQPEIRLAMTEDGQLRVFVEYPSRYAALVELIREDTDDLTGDNWTVTSVAILNPDGTIESLVELNEAEGEFFRYRLELR